MNIKQILASLTQAQRTQIDYAFENGLINQFIEYAPGRFIGVNIQNLSNLQIEQTAGLYSAGTILQGQAYVVQFPTHPKS